MKQSEIIEVMARAVYDHWIFAPQVPWVNGGNSVKQGDARAFARAAIASLTAKGLAIVPVKPTEAMIKAGVAYRLRTTISSENNWPTDTAALFRAMIAVEG